MNKMSWFDSAGLAGFAKTALTSAQKKIDKVLDIEEIDNSSSSTVAPALATGTATKTGVSGISSSRTSARAKLTYATDTDHSGSVMKDDNSVARAPPSAPKTPSSIKRDANDSDDTSAAASGGEVGNDWASQSSLWSSWFDFGGKEQGGEAAGGRGGGVGASEKLSKLNEASRGVGIVAAQPPGRVNDRTDDKNQPVEEKTTAEKANISIGVASRNLSVEPAIGTSTKSKRSKESLTEQKRAPTKPTPPKKLGHRLRDEKEVGSLPSEETATDVRDSIAEKGVASISDMVESPLEMRRDSEGICIVSTSSANSVDAASSYSSQSSVATVIECGNQRRPPASSVEMNLFDLSAASSTTSVAAPFDIAAATTAPVIGGDSLSASACWEVKEGDAEVDAILRLHEDESDTSEKANYSAPSLMMDNESNDAVQSCASSSSVATDGLPDATNDPSFFSPDIQTKQPSSSSLISPTTTFPPSSGDDVFPFHRPLRDGDDDDDDDPTALHSTNEFTSCENTSSLSTATTITSSISDPTAIHAAHSDQDLTTFSLGSSQSSHSVTKLTDSSTTEGTPDDDDKDDGMDHLGKDLADKSMNGVGNDISEVAVTPSHVPSSTVDSKTAASSTSNEAVVSVVEPTMTSSVISVSSAVVKDLLGDAMTESLSGWRTWRRLSHCEGYWSRG